MGIWHTVATPIGNLEDISLRAIKTLLGVPVIACEDTRRTGQLVKILRERYSGIIGITPYDPPLNLRGGRQGELFTKKFISVRDFNEVMMVPRVLEELARGDVALLCDAGTPLLSDPGFKVVRAARKAGFKVVPIPGPFAAAAALSASGLPTNKFMFWGFLPKDWDLNPGMTHVIYESPVRLPKLLKTLKGRYPEAEVVVAAEMTKIHESFLKGEDYLAETTKAKGEVTVLVYVPEYNNHTPGV